MSPVAHQRLTDAMRKYRRDGARLAAMILLAEPQRLTGLATVDFLRQIPYIRNEDEQIAAWLAPPECGGAGINPLRPGNHLTGSQRRRLACLLVAYARAER